MKPELGVLACDACAQQQSFDPTARARQALAQSLIAVTSAVTPQRGLFALPGSDLSALPYGPQARKLGSLQTDPGFDPVLPNNKGGQSLMVVSQWKSRSILAVGTGLLALAGGRAALAQEVVITEVAVASDTITIRGANLDNGRSLAVTLGDDPTPLAISGIPTGSEIVVECPPGPGDVPTCVAGDFLLTVTTGPGRIRTGTYDLTVGAVGPAGPAGPEGPQGPPGLSDYRLVEGPPAAGVESFTSTASCPGGTLTLGGGGRLLSGSVWALSDSYPVNAGRGWRVRYRHVSEEVGDPGIGQAWAICAEVGD